MTVKQLKKELSHYSDDTDVMIECVNMVEYVAGVRGFNSLESVTPRKIFTGEYPDHGADAIAKVLVLSDEI